MEVLRGVPVLRIVTAADVTARSAQAQMHPRIAHLQAFLAALCARLVREHRAEMVTSHAIFRATKMASRLLASHY